jgi:hypothetical protein
MTGSDARMPSDPSLLGVLGALEDDGYVDQFVPRARGVVRCTAGDHEFSASSAVVDQNRRLEGVSDPADMVIVLSLHCPICDRAGTLVLHYGPEASAEESDALDAFERPGRPGGAAA